ncbi:MAG TPA: peptidase inhibitor family I36 protein [Acidobacteriaceae bacterium]|nr:peptidase inhibitor family I36 protein [Acidobacteriaceae bacterium]
MKRFAAFLILVFLGFAVSAYAQQGQRMPPDNNWAYGPQNNQWNPSWDRRPNPRSGACFYTTAPFRGHHFCVRSGDRLPSLPGGFGDNISSIQIFGRARVRIFNDRNYRNGSAELDRSVSDLRTVPFRKGHTWNNRISSIVVY